MTFLVNVAADKYDEAMLRLGCAQNLIACLCIMHSAKDADEPSKEVLDGALYGIGLLLDDVTARLHCH